MCVQIKISKNKALKILNIVIIIIIRYISYWMSPAELWHHLVDLQSLRFKAVSIQQFLVTFLKLYLVNSSLAALSSVFSPLENLSAPLVERSTSYVSCPLPLQGKNRDETHHVVSGSIKVFSLLTTFLYFNETTLNFMCGNFMKYNLI